MTHLNFTQMLRICPTGRIRIGIKRGFFGNPQIPNGTSLNSDIKQNKKNGGGF
jgi:hypothetical protein